MQKSRRLMVLLCVTLVIAALAGWQTQAGLAEGNDAPPQPFLPLPEAFQAASTEGALTSEFNKRLNADLTTPLNPQNFKLDLSMLENVAAPEMMPSAAQEEICGNLLVNPALDIVIIDPDEGRGTAEPWIPLIQQIYYDGELFNSPQYSLAMVIGDADNDPDTPEQDAFGQAFFTPDNLTRVFIEYYVTLDFANSIDEVYGELYTVNANTGQLENFIGGWRIDEGPVPPAPPNWQRQFLDITDANFLAAVEDQLLAIVFSNFTSDPSPGEIVWLDDIQITACIERAANNKVQYLPVVVKRPSGPVCLPPSENPRDELTTNRGYVEVNATCQTGLSNLDQQDYYTFRTGPSGNYTFNLRNLPSGTEWSLGVIVLEPRGYAPGPTGGDCRIAIPGSGNKAVTCNLQGNREYVVRVSGDGNAGNYTMRVTR